MKNLKGMCIDMFIFLHCLLATCNLAFKRNKLQRNKRTNISLNDYFFLFFFKQPNQEHTLHVTPLPKKMAFYDANADGQISIKEFARTLGHDPRAFHVKDAFRVADSNGIILLFDLSCKSLTNIKTWVLMYIFLFFSGDGLVDAYEFENDAWIFDDDFDDDGNRSE